MILQAFILKFKAIIERAVSIGNHIQLLREKKVISAIEKLK